MKIRARTWVGLSKGTRPDQPGPSYYIMRLGSGRAAWHDKLSSPTRVSTLGFWVSIDRWPARKFPQTNPNVSFSSSDAPSSVPHVLSTPSNHFLRPFPPIYTIYLRWLLIKSFKLYSIHYPFNLISNIVFYFNLCGLVSLFYLIK